MSLNNGVITKGELKFWMGLIAIIISGVIAFTTLRMEVEALQDKGVKLREEYERSIVEIRGDLKEIKNNQIRIMIELGIKPTS